MPRHYPVELRRQICERLLEGEPVKKLRAEFGISEYTLYRWRRQARVDAGLLPRGKSFEADRSSKPGDASKSSRPSSRHRTSARQPLGTRLGPGADKLATCRRAGENLHVVPRGSSK